MDKFTKINTFPPLILLLHFRLRFQCTVENGELPYFHGGSLEIMLTLNQIHGLRLKQSLRIKIKTSSTELRLLKTVPRN